MNITNVKCPNCGASLSVDGNSRSIIYCQYCGASVHLETAHSTGYDLEMGRREAIADAADNYVNILQELRDPMLSLPKDYNDIQACEKTINTCERNIAKYSKPSTAYKTPSIVSGCAVLFLCMIAAPFLVFIIAGILSIGGYILSGQSCVKNGKKAEELLEKKQQELESLKLVAQRKENIISKYPEVNIPPQYRTEKAFDYFINLFKSRQAFTLEEAYSRYSEVVKQEEALDLQRQQIELQQKQIEEMQRLQKQMQKNKRRR